MTWPRTAWFCPEHGSVSRTACHASVGGPLCCSYCPPGSTPVEEVEVVPVSSGDPTGALRLCLEALDRHDAWCGHNPDAPGDGIINRARDAAEAVLRPVSSGVDEWTCPHGTTYAGSADFVRGARIAHQEYERASGDAERIARRFHEAYERLAPDFGYRTREASAVPWKDVPEANRRLMIATVREVLRAAPATEGGGGG